MTTLTIRTLLFAILSAGVPASHASAAPVASSAVTAKSVTIRYTTGLLLPEERRKGLAELLKSNFDISETKYQVVDSEKQTLEVVEVSAGVDRAGVVELVHWYVFEYDPCDSEG